ncbi:hypothetical protein RchiOBHm_Chr3g0463671 [Rosa chinensis]|uniref:RNase H type-1 domain-containing protein n=1 Tax=Rosa chinensis TaxID=74649 RepID=A0A2P6R985_ROSCH|nr:hypothetical protein RchiOBHm_Chr3g0463671 [Rosa chinensis]
MLETDAMEVQRQVSAYDAVNTSLLGRIYEDVRLLLETQNVLHVSHIGRHGNMVAHLLARHACSLTENEFYFSVPDVLQAVIAADICAL